jgi:hypothetical protein
VKTLTMSTPSQLASLTASATFQDPAVLLVRADTTSYDYDGNFFFERHFMLIKINYLKV